MTGRNHDPISQFIQRHAADRLRSYQGNLAFAVNIVHNGWLPVENDPVVQQHIETLRQHLAAKGREEDDRFLLRLGLTVPGMQKGIVPPLMVLEANRGGFSAKRQRGAAGHILRWREALAIGRHFIANLSSDTQQALAELADLSQGRATPGDLDQLRWFDALTSDQAAELAQRAVGYLDSHDDCVKESGTQVLQNLACFRGPPLSKACLGELVERRVFWPASIYRDGGDEVACQLLSVIEETADLLSLNHILLALAWTRSSAANQAFHHWTSQPPGWASKLHMPPKEYLQIAGRCLNEDGQPRELISARCCRLMPAEEATPRSIPCRTRIDEQCPSCGGSLCCLFDFSQLGAQYFPGEYAEAPRQVLCCLHCACFGTVYSTYRGDGTGQWHSGNKPCEFASSDYRESCLRELGDSPSPPFACAEAFGLDDASTLGGLPMWLQDAAFPRCIECDRLMNFLAQLDNGPLSEEGIYYAFFCGPCRVAAVSYQQT